LAALVIGNFANIVELVVDRFLGVAPCDFLLLAMAAEIRKVAKITRKQVLPMATA